MNKDDLIAFQMEIEEPYEKQIEKLKEELQTERKRVAAYKTLVVGLEQSISFYSRELENAKEAVRQLQSEREANEILTNENELLRKQLDELRSQEVGAGQYICLP